MASLNVPPSYFWLRQGEIIENLFELRLTIYEGMTIDLSRSAKVERIDHPYAIIVTQDCDLEWDYKARQSQASSDKLLTHVLLCALFSRDEIKVRSRLNSDLFRRVKANQDERYHCLASALMNQSNVGLPDLFADFKTTFSLPIEFVYWLVQTGQVTRGSCLRSPYLEDFMHRLYGFLGRVAVPSPEQA